MFVRVVLPLAVVLLIAAARPAQDTKKELDKLQGEWTIVSEEQFGKKLPGAKIERYTLTKQNDAENGGESHEWTANPEGVEGSAVPCETRLVAAKGQSGEEESAVLAGVSGRVRIPILACR